ncbi:MAG: hypothetical protein JRI59_02945 [Deltaproteobacteria bacterium]|nr:hypothetical protein [Deltaproteobacteria bacterium]
MNQKVETYSGGRLHERPRRFLWQGQWLQVEEVLDRWQTPEYLGFTVKAQDGRVYQLRYRHQQDAWEISDA